MSERTRRVLILAALTLAAAAKSALWATTQPLYSPLDEAQHYDYVARLASEGRPPKVGEDVLPPERLRIFRTSDWFADRSSLGGDPTGLGAVPLDPVAFQQALANAGGPGFAQESYEGRQSPVAYALLAPAYALSGPEGAGRVTAVRLANGLVAAAAVPFVYLLCLALFPGRFALSFVAAGAAGLVQAVSAVGGTVSNDALGITATAAALWAIARACTRGGHLREWLLAGGVTGFAILNKPTAFFLVPGTVLAIAVRHRARPLEVASRAGAAAGAALLVYAPWVAYMLSTYGTLQPAFRPGGQQAPIDLSIAEFGGRVGAVGRVVPQLRSLRHDTFSSHLELTTQPTIYENACWLLVMAAVAGGVLAVWRKHREGPAIFALLAVPVLLVVTQLLTLGGTTGRRTGAMLPAVAVATVAGLAVLIPAKLRVPLGALIALVLLSLDALETVRGLHAFYVTAVYLTGGS